MAHSFGDFSPWMVDPIVLGTMKAQCTIWDHVVEEVSHLMAGKQSKTGRVRGPNIPFKVCPQ